MPEAFALREPVDIGNIESFLLAHQKQILEQLDSRLSRHEAILNGFTEQWTGGTAGQQSCLFVLDPEDGDQPINIPESNGEVPDNHGEDRLNLHSSVVNPKLSLTEVLDEDENSRREAEVMGMTKSGERSQHPREHDRKQGLHIRDIVKNRAFELAISFLIFCNSALLGIEVEYMAREKIIASPIEFKILSWCFSACFALELVMRIITEGSRFFRFHKKIWNCFDTLVVASSIIEIMIDAISSNFNAGTARSTKLVRVGRIARTIRIYRSLRVASIIRFLSAFQILIVSIGACMKSLIWAIILMVMIVYVFGIIFTQATTGYLLEGHDDQILVAYWGTLGDSMFTLYKSVTGGVNWQEVIAPLGRMHWLWVALFTVYVTFIYFAVLNVVTGVFCNSAIDTGRRDPEMVAQSMQSDQRWFSGTLKQLFTMLDENNSGMISLVNLETCLHKDEVQALFHALDLEIHDAWSLFKLVDTGKAREINLEQFIKGCIELRGGARNLDIAALKTDYKNLLRLIASLALRLENTVLAESAKSQANLEQMHQTLSQKTLQSIKQLSTSWSARSWPEAKLGLSGTRTDSKDKGRRPQREDGTREGKPYDVFLGAPAQASTGSPMSSALTL